MTEVEVTQADAAWANALFSSMDYPRTAPFHVAQAFACHRIASTQALQDQVSKLMLRSLRFQKWWTQERERASNLQIDVEVFQSRLDAAEAEIARIRRETLEEAAQLIERRNPNEGGRQDATAIRSLGDKQDG